MRRGDRYLQKRGVRWHYVRRVPGHCQALDGRRIVRVALKTGSLEIGRERRDAMEAADEALWGMLGGVGEDCEPAQLAAKAAAERRYRSAVARAVSRGFSYAPADELPVVLSMEEMIRRISAVDRIDTGDTRLAVKAEALLGGVKRPGVRLSESFETYCEHIAIGEIVNKSTNQTRLWRKTKQRAVSYFIDVVADLHIEEITRQQALEFYNWWAQWVKAPRAPAL